MHILYVTFIEVQMFYTTKVTRRRSSRLRKASVKHKISDSSAATSDSAESSSALGFLSLPTEVRQMIYDALLDLYPAQAHCVLIRVLKCRRHAPPRRTTKDCIGPMLLSLAQTCRIVCCETLPLIYERSVFYFRSCGCSQAAERLRIGSLHDHRATSNVPQPWLVRVRWALLFARVDKDPGLIEEVVSGLAWGTNVKFLQVHLDLHHGSETHWAGTFDQDAWERVWMKISTSCHVSIMYLNHSFPHRIRSLIASA